MPRSLHAALVATLTLSPFLDSARACWQCPTPHGSCGVEVVSCDRPVEVVWVHVGCPVGDEAAACGEPSWCDTGVGGASDVVMDCCLGRDAPASAGGEPCCRDAVVSEVVVDDVAVEVPVEVAAPTPAETSLENHTLQDAASVMVPEPAVESVQPASAELLPPRTGPAPAADQVPTTAPEPNIFEEVEGVRPVSPGDVGPQTDGAIDGPPEAAPERPDLDQRLEPAAAEPDDPFSGADRGPAARRRWIDHSGRFAVVAALIAVRDDGTCVLDAAGRSIEVSTAALSAHDRGYVARAAGAMAGAVPDPRDTAGR